jgi:hypothetical protein
MNQLFGGSICLTDLIDHAKKGHSAFSKAQNGKVYCNILTWINDEKDKFGNTMSHQLSSSKERRDAEGKIYIGNSKKLETSKPVSPNDIDEDLHNVPVREKAIVQEEAADDLPF